VYSGFVIPDEDGNICAGQRCSNVWCPGHPSCGDPRQTGCPGLLINGMLLTLCLTLTLGRLVVSAYLSTVCCCRSSIASYFSSRYTGRACCGLVVCVRACVCVCTWFRVAQRLIMG
jgi:hypothetical protein